MSRRFVDFVREIEGKLTDDERRELDAWREHFRGDDGLLAGGVREPGPRPPAGPAPVRERMTYRAEPEGAERH